MQTKRMAQIKKITSRLAWIKCEIELDNVIHFYDINISMEVFICSILNILYDYDLVNLNHEFTNYPGIDLGDRINRIAIQITSDSSRTKTKETIDTFIKNGYEKEYNRLIIFILGEKTIFRREFDTQGTFSFDKNKDVWDFKFLIKEIEKASDEKLNLIDSFIEENLIVESFENKAILVERKYESVENVLIPRKLILEKDVEVCEYGWDKGIKLQSIIKEQKRLVLISDAAFGKTTSIKMFNNEINSEESNQYAFYHSLKTYSGEKIEEFVPQSYVGVPIENIVMFLDGFDEISNNQVTSFINQLEKFIENNRDTTIVITSRGNFYHRCNEKYGGTFERFSEYMLAPLMSKDINRYLKNRNVDKEKFWIECVRKEYREFIKSPFYLVRAVELFIQDAEVPAKSKFMSALIEKSFQWDLKKQRNKNYGEEKEDAYKLLQIIALALECLEKNFLTDDEYKQLITEKKQRELVELSLLWNKNNHGWSFEHNNFGEYLAAEFLADIPIVEIKKIITYESSPNRLRNSWMNALSFLIEFVHDDEFEQWLLDKNPEIYAQFERHGIDNDKLFEIFKVMFENYETKRIWIEKSRKIGRCFASKQMIKYLLDKIEQNIHFTVVANALSLFMDLKELYEEDEYIKEVLLKVCLSNNYRTHEKYYALLVLSKNGLADSNSLKKIVNFNKDNEDKYLRAGYYAYCEYGDIVDENIDLILEKAKITKRHIHASWEEVDGECDLMDETLNLNACFAKLKTLAGLEKAIDRVLTKKSNYESEEYLRNILLSVENIAKQGQVVIPQVVSLLKYYDMHLQCENIRMIYEVIDENNWNEDILKELDNRGIMICYKNSEEVVDERKKSDKKIKYELSKYSYLEAVYDKQKYNELIQEFFSLYGKNVLTYKEICDFGVGNSNERYDLLRVKRLLKAYIKEDESVSNSFLEDIDWEHFFLFENYHLIAEKKVQLSDGQKEILAKVCNERVKDINFRKAITYTSETEFSINQIAWYLWYFAIRLEIKYPENALLDMLQIELYIHDVNSGMEYIVRNVSKHKVRERVIENLKNQDIRGSVFENHINYCIENQISECEIAVKNVLEDNERSLMDRQHAVKYLVNILGGDRFISKYENLIQGEEYWQLFSAVFENDRCSLNAYLEEKLFEETDEDVQMKYAKLLIDNNSCVGLEFYVNWMFHNRKSYKKDDAYYGINASMANLNNPQVIDLLIQAIELSYETDFNDNGFETMGGSARKALIAIAKTTRELSYEIIGKIEVLIQNRRDLPDIGFCHYIIREIEDEVLREEKNSLDETVNILRNVIGLKKREKRNNWLS